MTAHKSVLLKETIEGLNISDGILVDCTFGGGGHSLSILKEYPKVKVIAIDVDESVWRRVEGRFKDFKDKISFHVGNFRDLDKILKSQKVDGIIFDLGLSSDQLENSGRGFSFMKDEPLVMTMKENPSPEDITAIEAVNEWGEESLAKVIAGYGEERFAKRIAKGILKAREKGEIQTTFDLSKVIEESIPVRYTKGRIHFATRTFQAIRMAVNDELGAVKEALPKAFDALRPGGRMAVISFHSLEDRLVKRFFKEKKEEKVGVLINKKPITAGEEELEENPRARSAKLRILEKIQ